MCNAYSPSEMYDILLRIRMEVMSGDKHEANRMLVLLQDLVHPAKNDDLLDDELGECDTCGNEYELASRDGRCGDCGNCATCCTERQTSFDCEACETERAVVAKESTGAYLTWVCTACGQESYELVGEE